MLISKLRDNSLVFESSWQDLRAKWRTAPTGDQLVFDDGRPAVLLYRDDDGRASYQTVPPAVWADIKQQMRYRTQALGLPVQHPKRARLCVQCGCEMKVSRETAECWAFACPNCRSREVLAKSLIGGTLGQGDVEKV